MREWECLGMECRYWQECRGWATETECQLLQDQLESEEYLRRKREQEKEIWGD